MRLGWLAFAVSQSFDFHVGSAILSHAEDGSVYL